MRDLLALSLAVQTMLASSTANYRSVRPVTTQNLGKNLLKYGSGRTYPRNGAREVARRLRQGAQG